MDNYYYLGRSTLTQPVKWLKGRSVTLNVNLYESKLSARHFIRNIVKNGK